MRTIQTAEPRRELREFVRSFAYREIVCEDGGFSQPNISTLEQVLAFELGDPMVLDHPERQSEICPRIVSWGSLSYPNGGASFSGHVTGFAIFLQPLASWQLFRISPGDIVDRHCDGGDLLGRGVKDLWLKLAESKTFSERVRVAEEYLLPFARNAHARTSIMKSAQHVFHHRGATRVDELANQTALSVRQYERRFAEEVGISPKLFAGITRFQRALDTKRISPDRSWGRVAHELGYFDQMHMIRDFQRLGGDAPGQLFQRSGDLQPWSLDSEMALELK